METSASGDALINKREGGKFSVFFSFFFLLTSKHKEEPKYVKLRNIKVRKRQLTKSSLLRR